MDISVTLSPILPRRLNRPTRLDGHQAPQSWHCRELQRLKTTTAHYITLNSTRDFAPRRELARDRENCARRSVDIDEHEGGSGRCDCCCQTECTCLRGRGIESFALPAGSEKPGACGDSGPADGAETPPSSPGDGDSSDGAAHAAATSVLVGLVAAFAV